MNQHQNTKRPRMTHEASDGRNELPAQLPPEEGVISDHLLDAVVPPVGAEAPADRQALEHDQGDETHSGGGVGI